MVLLGFSQGSEFIIIWYARMYVLAFEKHPWKLSLPQRIYNPGRIGFCCCSLLIPSFYSANRIKEIAIKKQSYF